VLFISWKELVPPSDTGNELQFMLVGGNSGLWCLLKQMFRYIYRWGCKTPFPRFPKLQRNKQEMWEISNQDFWKTKEFGERYWNFATLFIELCFAVAFHLEN
jgi:hypothetical protein